MAEHAPSPELQKAIDWLRNKDRLWVDNTWERLAYYLGVSVASIARWSRLNTNGPIDPVVQRRLIWLAHPIRSLAIGTAVRILGWIPNMRESLPAIGVCPPEIIGITYTHLRQGRVIDATFEFNEPFTGGLCFHTTVDAGPLGFLKGTDPLDSAEVYSHRWVVLENTSFAHLLLYNHQYDI